MTKIEYLSDVQRNPDTVLTVGTFDGVHEGHKVLIRRVVEKAEKYHCRSAVVTFDPHPREVINAGKDRIHLLTTLHERAEILADLGVDLMIVIPFDRDFSLLSSEEFIRNIIYKEIGVKLFVIGYDHQFGHNREGGRSTVRELGKALGFDVHVVEAHEIGEITVSSSSVRRALEQRGDVDLARKFLGRPYRICGTVVHGDSRGKQIGYPTANIQPENHKKVIPQNGVYAVNVTVDGNRYKGMMNIGIRPTFEPDNDRTLEVNIFDFNENIYGLPIEVHFIHRIRDELKFNSVEELIKAIDSDKEIAQKINK